MGGWLGGGEGDESENEGMRSNRGRSWTGMGKLVRGVARKWSLTRKLKLEERKAKGARK